MANPLHRVVNRAPSLNHNPHEFGYHKSLDYIQEPSPEDYRKAAFTVLGNAINSTDAAQLLDMLGLTDHARAIRQEGEG